MSRALALAAAIGALAAGCGIDKRTAAYRCDNDSDCDGDRRCEEGYCTLGPREQSDAAPGAPDAPVIPQPDAPLPDAFICPAECTGGCLDDFTCVIDCSLADSCATPIVCPGNLPCQVDCTGVNSCLTTIDCAAALGCDVTCGGAGACSGAITCPAGEDCDVLCSETDTCAGGVVCNASCACDVMCTGTDSCATPATCPPGPANACDIGLGCSSTTHNQCDDC